MANQYKNKVIYNNNTIIDISDTTAMASDVASGKYFYLATGEKVEGTASSGGSGLATVTVMDSTITATDQDTSGYVVWIKTQQIDDMSETLVDDTNYIVTLDGTPYLCHANVIYGGDDIYCGDIQIVGGTPSNAIYPFAIGSYSSGNVQWMIGDNQSHSVKVERVISMNDSTTFITKTITVNGTYSAEDDNADGYSQVVVNVSSGSNGPTYETYFDDSIMVDENGISIASLADLYFAEGETWRVTWDGVEYICETLFYQGWLWYVGNEALAGSGTNTSEPFCLYNYGGNAMNGVAQTAGTHTLKLEKQTSSGSDDSTNPLSGKILSTTGDSIAAGAGNNGSGYPELVASDNNMTLQNVAVGGGTVAYIDANTFCISRSISSMRSDADFVLLEGGGNDADSGVPLGTLSSGYTATLDDTTFAGAIESMFKTALTRFPDKKIGYVFIHKCATLFDSRIANSYYDIAKSACEKWGIPYLDLNTQVPPLNYIADLRSTYTANADGYHPNELGYRTFYVSKITAFLNTMLTDNSLINKIVTENGTYLATDDSADGYSSVTVNVPSGASNVVTGTFKGTTTGAAMDVTLNYSGSGYPIAVMIFPSNTNASTFQSTIQRYAVRDCMLEKYAKATSPTYSKTGDGDSASLTVKYKSSSSNSANYSNSGSTVATQALYADEAATNTVTAIVKIRSKTKISVFIASSSYGFMANIEYSYVVIYSS